MKFLPAFLACLVTLALSAPSVNIELDPEDNDTLEQFEKNFNKPEITDPVEKAKREETLKKNEALVKEENEGYLEHNNTWHSAINDLSDLTEEEVKEEKTGAKVPETRYGRGLVMPTGADRVDPKSEAFFAAFRSSMKTNRASTPTSYSAVDEGHVSPVTNQGECGSCVAFANMAAIETCFHKITGVFGDYSEQQMVDCGYDGDTANGCNGASPHAYIKWAAESKPDLTAEATYPYLNTSPKLTCDASLALYNQGAKVSGLSYTYSGDEETLKGLVATYGAVVSGVYASGNFASYSGGIFAGCTSSSIDHAITVVGYGTDSGVDYWLIKNSWGTSWGEDGFIRLQRGVGMCGIGSALVKVECEAVAGATDATITTEAPCTDTYSNCADLCSYVPDDCKKSCGGC